MHLIIILVGDTTLLLKYLVNGINYRYEFLRSSVECISDVFDIKRFSRISMDLCMYNEKYSLLYGPSCTFLHASNHYRIFNISCDLCFGLSDEKICCSFINM